MLKVGQSDFYTTQVTTKHLNKPYISPYYDAFELLAALRKQFECITALS